MIEYSIKFVKGGGYSFDEDSIRKLASQAKQFTEQEPEIEVRLRGGHAIRKKADRLFDDPFLKQNIIEKLEISSERLDRNPPRQVSIVLGYQIFFETVIVNIAGDRDACVVAHKMIENAIDARRTGYVFLYPTGYWSFGLGLGWWFFVFGIALYVAQYFDLKLPYAVLITGLCTLLFGSISFISERLMFPKLVFEIGISSRIGRRGESWRNVVLKVIVLGFFVGLVTTKLADKIRWPW